MDNIPQVWKMRLSRSARAIAYKAITLNRLMALYAIALVAPADDQGAHLAHCDYTISSTILHQFFRLFC
jgi:hypothetical protein